MMKSKELDLYMKFAVNAADLSTATKLKVGAVIVNNNSLAYGYNGTPRGWDNSCEAEIDGAIVTHDCVIHAEENAILKCAADGIACKGGTMFVSHAPCLPCATKIIQAQLGFVYYKYDYKSHIGVNALKASGIIVKKLDDETYF